MSTYNNGTYYKETYLKEGKSLNLATKWMINYYKAVRKSFPSLAKYKNAKILEIGSGYGAFINILNEAYFQDVTASDVSNLIFSKELKNNHIFLDLLKPPPADHSKFDFIFAFDVLEHINNTEFAIQNLKSLLADNGYFIFSTPYPAYKHLKDKYHTNMQLPFYYTNILNRSGFEILSIKNFSFFPLIWRFKLPFLVPFVLKNRFFISQTFFVCHKLG